MNKKVKIILLILILILLILIIRSTYSKYTAESSGTINENLAMWYIKVNDTDISVAEPKNQEDANTTEDNSTLEYENATFYIMGADVIWEGDSHISPGKIAPGMKGYFYIRIDPQKTQTALKYTINVNINSILEGHVDFRITNITEENGKDIHIMQAGTRGQEVSIQRIKLLDEIKSSNESQRIDKIKVDLQWIDSEETNIFDTKVGETIDKDFRIPVSVDVIQYTGEEYDF